MCPRLQLGVVAIEKGAFWSPSTSVVKFTFTYLFSNKILINQIRYIEYFDNCIRYIEYLDNYIRYIEYLDNYIRYIEYLDNYIRYIEYSYNLQIGFLVNTDRNKL